MINNLNNYGNYIFQLKNHVTIPRSKPKLLCSWQPRSSGKIKIHTTLFCNYSSGEWLTDWQAETRGVSAAQSHNKKKKPFTSKQRSRWLHESTLAVSLVYPPSCGPALPPSPFKSQTAHMQRAAGRSTWQITTGLIIKNQHSPEGVAGERRERKEGCGRDSNKACWASTHKGEGQISPAADKQKRIHFNYKWLPLGSNKELHKGHRESEHACISVFTWTVCFWCRRR